jgi:hypothetical protein
VSGQLLSHRSTQSSPEKGEKAEPACERENENKLKRRGVCRKTTEDRRREHQDIRADSRESDSGRGGAPVSSIEKVECRRQEHRDAARQEPDPVRGKRPKPLQGGQSVDRPEGQQGERQDQVKPRHFNRPDNGLTTRLLTGGDVKDDTLPLDRGDDEVAGGVEADVAPPAIVRGRALQLPGVP